MTEKIGRDYTDQVPGKDLNIYERILGVKNDVGYIQKDQSVSMGGGSYKAVTHDMVTSMTRAAFIKWGIVSAMTRIDDFVMPIEGDKSKAGVQRYQYQATFAVSFVNVDNPEDAIHMQVPAQANDYGDKAVGKAMSMAKKYAILKILDIETGESEESREEMRPESISKAQYNELKDYCRELGFEQQPVQVLKALAKLYEVKSGTSIPVDKFSDAKKHLKEKAIQNGLITEGDEDEQTEANN